ncbi:hypothetical protein M2271_008042 [Streptomyces sp. LBL]|uniref:hypothetical protein n=1 Tax=Streptomyces sp. LBL TaxID=2940562 RepID=UPI0024747477|nr:hypothetical protein [Streptomyces sp. LBL]MDH6630188.1 hypothetical protein [Streptomyces sp. LBL]
MQLGLHGVESGIGQPQTVLDALRHADGHRCFDVLVVRRQQGAAGFFQTLRHAAQCGVDVLVRCVHDSGSACGGPGRVGAHGLLGIASPVVFGVCHSGVLSWPGLPP